MNEFKPNLLKIKELSLVSWILSVFKVIFLAFAVTLFFYSNMHSSNWEASSKNMIASLTGFSWLVFIITGIATIALNIIIYLKTKAISLDKENNKEQLQKPLYLFKILSLVSIILLSMIFNIYIYAKSTIILKDDKYL